jgi:hypothetical protein
MYFHTLAQSVSTLTAALICGYALWKGAATERLAAVAVFAAWMGTPLLQHLADPRRLQFTVFVVDGALTATLLAIALASSRFWPLWGAAFQLLELLTHVAMLVDHKVHPRAYFIGMEIWSYMVLAALAVGVWREAALGGSKPLAA